MRILHVFRAPLGGLFRHVLDLAQGQIARGHQVGILCDSREGGARAEEVLAALEPNLALGILRTPMNRNPGPSDVATFKKVIAYRDETKPDILHGHGSKGGVYSRLPALARKDWPVTCYTPHGGSFNYYPGTLAHRVYMATERFLGRYTDAFLLESEYIAQKVYESVGPTSAIKRIVHNGIAPEEFAPISRTGHTADFLYIGELRFAKGINTLLDALDLLKKRGVHPRLLIVGSGPDKEALDNRVAELALDKQVSFSPPMPIRSALSLARIMVVPSRAESLPYVVLEAAAAAEPLVSTNVGGIPEIFGPYAGRLIDPDNAPLMAERLQEALSRPEAELYRDAALLADHVRAHFSLNEMIDGVIAGYRAAIDRRIAS